MLYLIFNTFLSLILLILPIILNMKMKWNSNKSSMFECGFDPFSLVRSPFSIRFFKLCLIFIFFDIEIIVTLPIALIIFKNNFIFWIFFLIIFIIFLGLIFEWQQNSLNWLK
nr:NADH dehydrogenase subunit 3 [Hypoaspis sp. 3 JO-2023a]